MSLTVIAVAGRGVLGGDGDRAAALHRVARVGEEVEQHAAQLALVELQGHRAGAERGADGDLAPGVLGGDLGDEAAQELLDQRLLALAAREARERQVALDDLVEALDLLLEHAAVVPQPLGLRAARAAHPLLEQVGVEEDRVERRADLVRDLAGDDRHRRELLRALEPALQLLHLGAVEHPGEQRGAPRPGAEPLQAQRHGARRAGGAGELPLDRLAGGRAPCASAAARRAAATGEKSSCRSRPASAGASVSSSAAAAGFAAWMRPRRSMRRQGRGAVDQHSPAVAGGVFAVRIAVVGW